MKNHTFYSVLTSEKGHFSFVNSITFFSYNSYILGTHLIDQFDIITNYIISEFKNPYYLFSFWLPWKPDSSLFNG